MDIEYFINNWQNIKAEDISFSIDEWIEISKYQYLSEDFIEKYKNEVYWGCISAYQSLSEDFIERYQDKVNWCWISMHQSLSEEFIEKHENKVYWNCISRYQSLSEEFIEKYKDKLNWGYISKCQSLSEKFIYKHQDKISYYNCLNKYYRLRYKLCIHDHISFSIHTNNNYGIFIQWKDKGFNLLTIPANIIFRDIL